MIQSKLTKKISFVIEIVLFTFTSTFCFLIAGKGAIQGQLQQRVQELGLEQFNAPKLDALETHGFILQKTETPKPHLLTHQKLHFVFYFFTGEKTVNIFDNIIWQDQKSLKNLPFPRPFLPFL